MGVVPAFALGVRRALQDGHEILACFHDDLLIEQDGWDELVLSHFALNDACGLLGFGGARGLGDPDLYVTPYRPMQLARREFLSNMRDAEAHGQRMTVATRVSCLDGFSQIGRREFWQGYYRGAPIASELTRMEDLLQDRGSDNLFEAMQALGVIHHFYDGMLGCYATRLGWETWMLPVRVHHYGGRTAVSDETYHAWAQRQDPQGDQGFWEAAHRIGYEHFRDVLPLRV